MYFYIVLSTGAQAADGMGMNAVAMVACAKPAELEAMLSGPLVEMGLVPSDVNGKKFYSAPVNFGEMLPMPVPGAEMLDVAPTLTIAGNWLVAGNRGAVEQAVKTQAGGAKAKTLSIPAAAMSQLGRDPAVMWGWANLGEQFAAQIEMVKSHGAELGAAAGENPQADMALAALSMMDLNQIRRQMGHAVWRVDSEKDGFMMKSIVIGSR